MATARRKTTARSSSPPRSSSASTRRVNALEHELAIANGQIGYLSARRRRAVRYGQELLVLVAVLALFYVFLLHKYHGSA